MLPWMGTYFEPTFLPDCFPSLEADQPSGRWWTVISCRALKDTLYTSECVMSFFLFHQRTQTMSILYPRGLCMYMFVHCTSVESTNKKCCASNIIQPRQPLQLESIQGYYNYKLW
jgi:hypothetical protein